MWQVCFTNNFLNFSCEDSWNFSSSVLPRQRHVGTHTPLVNSHRPGSRNMPRPPLNLAFRLVWKSKTKKPHVCELNFQVCLMPFLGTRYIYEEGSDIFERARISTLPLLSRVVLEKSATLSGPQSSYLWNSGIRADELSSPMSSDILEGEWMLRFKSHNYRCASLPPCGS